MSCSGSLYKFLLWIRIILCIINEAHFCVFDVLITKVIHWTLRTEKHWLFWMKVISVMSFHTHGTRTLTCTGQNEEWCCVLHHVHLVNIVKVNVIRMRSLLCSSLLTDRCRQLGSNEFNKLNKFNGDQWIWKVCSLVWYIYWYRVYQLNTVFNYHLMVSIGFSVPLFYNVI